MMRNLKAVERVFYWVFNLAVVSYLALQAWPTLLFPYSYKYGNLLIATSEPVDHQHLQTLVTSVLGASSGNVLPLADETYEVFIHDGHLLYRLFVPLGSSSFGFYNAIFRKVHINKADIISNRAFSQKRPNDGRPLHELILHETCHQSLQSRLGFLKAFLLEEWQREGLCEYVAKGSSIVKETDIEDFLARREPLHSSAKYLQYRSYVSFLIEKQGLDVMGVIRSSKSESQIDEDIRLWLEQNG